MSRRIAILVFDGVQSLDALGPAEVFSQAGRHCSEQPYRVEVVAPAPDPVRTSCGVQIVPDAAVSARSGPLDTLMVAGGSGTRPALRDAALIEWVRRSAAKARRVTSVCTGAFLLAQAGLLDGRRATTHWAACDALASAFPAVEVQRDPIYVRDGNVITSAGVTAGIDLALALVEDDLGPEVSLAVARQLVLFVRRPGGQEQFSTAMAAQQARTTSLRELQNWILRHPEADLSVAALAARMHVSERHLARLFLAEIGVSPGHYVQTVRVERARLLLQSSDRDLEEVARVCGFGTVETLRRTFARRLRVSPSHYRARFARAA